MCAWNVYGRNVFDVCQIIICSCDVVYSVGDEERTKNGTCVSLNDFGCKECEYKCDGDGECLFDDSDACDDNQYCLEIKFNK